MTSNYRCITIDLSTEAPRKKREARGLGGGGGGGRAGQMLCLLTFFFGGGSMQTKKEKTKQRTLPQTHLTTAQPLYKVLHEGSEASVDVSQ